MHPSSGKEKSNVDLLDGDALNNLKRDAEMEMGRRLWEEEEDGAVPKEQYEPGREIGRYKYDAVKDLEQGVRGLLISCRFHRERTSIREVTDRVRAGQDEEKRFGIVKLSFRGMAMLLDQRGSDEEAGANGDDIKDNRVMKVVQGLMESAREDGLQFTHRVSPVLRSCGCTESALEDKGKSLISCVLSSDVFDIGKNSGIKFAVVFHGRGFSKDKGDRLKYIHAIAKGFSDEYASKTGFAATVDLKHPDVVVSVDHVDVMKRGYMVLGVYPFTWCEGASKLALKSLMSKAPSHGKKRKNRDDDDDRKGDAVVVEEAKGDAEEAS